MDEDGRPETNVVIGLYEAVATHAYSGAVDVELRGVSTAAWKEFMVNWSVRLLDGNGAVVGETATNAPVRAENSPQPVAIRLRMRTANQPTSSGLRLEVAGAVERMTAAYHGHGRWMHLAKQD